MLLFPCVSCYCMLCCFVINTFVDLNLLCKFYMFEFLSSFIFTCFSNFLKSGSKMSCWLAINYCSNPYSFLLPGDETMLPTPPWLILAPIWTDPSNSCYPSLLMLFLLLGEMTQLLLTLPSKMTCWGTRSLLTLPSKMTCWWSLLRSGFITLIYLDPLL